MSEQPRKKISPRFSAAWLYILFTIAAIMIAVLVSSKNFFNPLNFQQDAVVYMDRNEYLNPMIISASRGAQKCDFESKKTLYAVIAYTRANIASMGEIEALCGSAEDGDRLMSADTTIVYNIYSQTKDSEPVFTFYLPEDSDFLILRAMPEYPEGEPRLAAMKINVPMSEALDLLRQETLAEMEASE